MNREDIIRMAREAGFMPAHDNRVERFAALVEAKAAAAERRANIACIGRIAALVGDPIDQARLYEAMDAIRARGQA